jgi:hypothetical protein
MVEYVCRHGTGVGKPYVVRSGADEPCTINVVWPTQYACSVVSRPAVSGGWVFVILVAVSSAVYLAIGMVYNAVKGLRGWDLLPNRGFWEMVKGLVVDGLILTGQFVTCCCPMKKPDDNYKGVGF